MYSGGMTYTPNTYCEPLTGTDAIRATLQHKLAIATARSQWGTRKQRQTEAEAAARYRARLDELGD